MGVQFQMCDHVIEIKNSFIHVSDELEEDTFYRSRALSEYSGKLFKELELKRSAPVPAVCMSAEEERATLMETPRICEEKEAGLDEPVPVSLFSLLSQEKETRTTVMMRDIPNSYSSNGLIELFAAAGFQGTYDFVYLPIDFRTNMSLGYAFVNFVSSWDALQFMRHFDGFSNWHFSSPKVCQVSWSDPNQGLQEHVERYRNSPVMHENVPDDFKPRLYKDGVRVAFPAPTKRIKPPRVRPAKQRR